MIDSEMLCSERQVFLMHFIALTVIINQMFITSKLQIYHSIKISIGDFNGKYSVNVNISLFRTINVG